MDNTNNSYGLRKEVLDSIRSIAAADDVGCLKLFGSRARGDYRERSDIDLAVYGGKVEKFWLDVEEDVPTLLKFDVIDMNKPISRELIDSIEKEGIIIYEKI